VETSCHAVNVCPVYRVCKSKVLPGTDAVWRRDAERPACCTDRGVSTLLIGGGRQEGDWESGSLGMQYNLAGLV
jgi:hypothetical protein